MKAQNKSYYIRGIQLGIFGQGIGVVTFLILEHLWMIGKFGIQAFDSRVDLEIAILIFVVGNILAFIPTVLGSSVLAWVLKNEKSHGTLSFPKSVLWGITTGAIAGIAVVLLAVLITNGRGGVIEYFFRALEVVALASFSGGWLGSKVGQTLLDDGPVLAQKDEPS